MALHHLYTRGSRPEHKDKDWNTIPVCMACHGIFHTRGTNFMAEKFPSVKEWLLERNWYLCDFSKKWRHCESE